MEFKTEYLSRKYIVRILTESDVAAVYALCEENPLYYQYCPPFVTPDSIRTDMKALPPRKTMEDKYYLGFYGGETLVAVMDLILGFPNEETAFVGFFMMNKQFQGKGTGTALMSEVYDYLKECGFSSVRLCFAKGNPQSEHFWMKNGFVRTGVEAQNEGYVAVVLEKELEKEN
jgi:RimJ/RimL family protein N-acetyltransferase